MTRTQIFSWFFIAIFLFIIYLFFEILQPFLLPMFWAAILALMLYPLYEKLNSYLKYKPNLASTLMTLLTLLVLVIPLLIVLTTVAVEIFDLIGTVSEKLEVTGARSIVDRIKDLMPVTIVEELEKRFQIGSLRFEEIILNAAGTTSKYIFDQVQQVAKNITSLLFNFVIMMFALFFFFRDGKKLYKQIKYLIPMTEEQKNRIFERFYNILSAVILGIIATAVVQGLVTGLIFWSLGLSFAVLAGVMTGTFSLLPVGGSVFVWLPVGIYLLLTGEAVRGIILLVLGGVIISSIDNVLKPWIIGGRVKLPTLFLVLSILGSVKAFGFSGIILGPVILVVFMSFIEIYKTEYREAK